MPARSKPNPESTSSEWRQQRRRARALIRSLPQALRRELHRIRRSDIREEIATAIIEHALDEAERRGLLKASARPSDARRLALPAIHRRALLRTLAGDPNYLQSVHRDVDQRLRAAHLEKVSSVPALPALSAVGHMDSDGTFIGDLGLGAASWMDEAPDDFYVYALEQVLRQTATELTLGSVPRLVRVLNLDPRGGSLARAAHALGAAEDLSVHEVGTELGPTDLPSVLQNRRGVVVPQGYDLVVWSVPSPAGPGAANQVQAYRQLDDPDLRRARYRVGDATVAVRSPAAVGIRRWLRSVQTVLTKVVAVALNEPGVAVLRLPLCVRVTRRARPGLRGFSGYVEEQQLAAEIPALLREAGLATQRSQAMEVVDGVNQPFVGNTQERWLLVVATRDGGNDA